MQNIVKTTLSFHAGGPGGSAWNVGPKHNALMLQQTQATLHNHVFKNRSRRNVNGLTLGRNDDDSAFERDAATQVDGPSDCEVIKLNDLRDRGNPLLEV